MIQYRTNIDCCKRFMADCNEWLYAANPMLGDSVQVHSSPGFEVEMKVVERHWRRHSAGPLVLEVWLASPNGFNIPEFEAILRNRGFSTT